MHSNAGPIILIVGTRPEGIKMIPLYFALKKAGYPTLLCSTMQHDELLTEVFDTFGVKPDFDLGIMRLGQDLFYITQSILQKTKELFIKVKPSLVIVQGDTSSTMAAGLAAFYLKIPVAHVEAGLRTDDLYAPFPEEMNRRFVSTIATYHFAPTSSAMANLLAQGIPRDQAFCTGNTVVDALRIMQKRIAQGQSAIRSDIKALIERARTQDKKIMLLTVHRRESFDGGIARIFAAIKKFLLVSPEIVCFYPYHPNPSVIQALQEMQLTALPNVYITEPINYKDMVYVLTHADIVLTDSGGIQEEALSLAKPLLVLREKTERMEGVWEGMAQLVGTDEAKINHALQKVLQHTGSTAHNKQIYGDGYAADKIVAILNKIFRCSRQEVYLNSALPDPVEGSIGSEFKQSHSVAPTYAVKNMIKKEDITVNKVCIVGLGYIGLPTAIIATEHFFEVVGFDVDQERVTKINTGDPVIHEPEIYEKLQQALGTGRFRATTEIEAANYFIVAVPTPFKEHKQADLSYVYAAGKEIAKVLKKDDVVILESTIPVGTTEQFAQFLQKEAGLQAGVDFFVAHCPERVLPGKIFHELIENDRIIGGINQESVTRAKTIYKQFVHGQLYLTNAATAEMVKLVENSSRDVQIAFANQVASMAYSIGLNPYEVIELANKHPRVKILNPGCGVGGHCIAVDPWFLVESFPEQTKLLKAAREVNDDKALEVIATVQQEIQVWRQTHATCTVAIFGLTYKPDIDDLRESPALFIAQKLAKRTDIQLLVCEPHISKSKLTALFGQSVVTQTQAVEQADIIVYLVGHKRFKAVDLKALHNKKIIDYCGVFYEPKRRSDEQEQLYWPARSLMDFFSKQKDTQHEPNQWHTPSTNTSKEPEI